MCGPGYVYSAFNAAYSHRALITAVMLFELRAHWYVFLINPQAETTNRQHQHQSPAPFSPGKRRAEGDGPNKPSQQVVLVVLVGREPPFDGCRWRLRTLLPPPPFTSLQCTTIPEP